MSNQPERKSNGDEGWKELKKKYKREFAIPENINFYPDEYYHKAQEIYVKKRLEGTLIMEDNRTLKYAP
ncbi:hypothetical protein GOV13_04455 [Candidatus Pacearchaeota archaeon]|nr:hypothetical protein [Candidatus Pacearchaeota archaeon]